jgi:hypothetical protein
LEVLREVHKTLFENNQYNSTMPGSDMMPLKRTADEAISSVSLSSDILRVSPEKTLGVPPAKSLDDGRSLASMMSARRSGLHSLHKKFAEEMEERRRVSFSVEEKLSLARAEPPVKRRRFQRRNSKTAAMLFSSMASIVASDFDEPEKEQEPKDRSTTEDSWDSGLEIAEELVRQLKLRRQSIGNAGP